LGGPFGGRGQARATASSEDAATDLESLKREADACTRNLERINARIAELEAPSQPTSGASQTT
jgi:hypothetical protein